ncbi:hypothetical protein EVAR_52475_1 [Eumeta japonica]|uniref:Uncharacterized protein n=1 Tax=Eumeta variegata TaxID=151549 RepID=A0A4C1YZ31_EUMVA|nr:hypothetical protein EVAR_52475_1 [Eumeta japonica]
MDDERIRARTTTSGQEAELRSKRGKGALPHLATRVRRSGLRLRSKESPERNSARPEETNQTFTSSLRSKVKWRQRSSAGCPLHGTWPMMQPVNRRSTLTEYTHMFPRPRISWIFPVRVAKPNTRDRAHTTYGEGAHSHCSRRATYRRHSSAVGCHAIFIRAIARALQFIHRYRAETLQATLKVSFENELAALKPALPTPRTNRLQNLTLKLDIDGNVRAKTKIAAASDVDTEAKSPPMVDGRHPYVRLYVQAVHKQLHHAGVKTTTNEKRYVALFTSLTLRAVHLKVAGGLSADSVILAIKRMIARRGALVEIRNHNGPTSCSCRRSPAKPRCERHQQESSTHRLALHSSWCSFHL